MLILRAARLFDSAHRRFVQQPLVVVEDGRITGVETGSCEAPSSADVVDIGDDATLLSGLIDAHVHLGFDASREPVAHMQADTDATLLLRMRLAAQRALAAGITTGRERGDRHDLGTTLRDWYRSGSEPGPGHRATPPAACRERSRGSLAGCLARSSALHLGYFVAPRSRPSLAMTRR